MSRFLLLCLVGLLAACGQKGPLYQPVPPAAPVVSAPVTVPAQVAPAEKDEKDKQDAPAAPSQP